MLRFFLFFALILLTRGHEARALSFGQPTVYPQFSTVEGVQLQAVDIDIPLEFESGVAEEVYVLSEGYVCPGLADASTCSGASATCVCDYAGLSSAAACGSELPACCASEDAEVYASACSGSESPTSWVVLTPDSETTVVVPGNSGLYDSGDAGHNSEPVYLRYHPSAEAQCRGFGLSIMAPFEELGEAISTNTLVLYYVSWTNARPETDPDALVLKVRPAQSDNTGRPRFCPSHSGLEGQASGFFGPANTRTAFIAMLCLSTDRDHVALSGHITVSLRETPDVTSLQLQAPASFPAWLPIADRTTYVVPSTLASATFSYTHSASTCQRFVADVHCQVDLAWAAMTASYVTTANQWQLSGFAPSTSVAVNICPGETLYFTMSSSGPPSGKLVTAYVEPTVDVFAINDVNPNLYGPVLAGSRATRLLCNSFNIPSLLENGGDRTWTNGAGRFPSFCNGAYIYSAAPACGFYPIANRVNATILWPAIPTGILGSLYNEFDFMKLSSNIGEPISSNLRYAYILTQVIFQSNYYGSTVGWVFRTWEELETCNLEFLGTLSDVNGNRLFGQSDPLGPLAVSENCDPETFSEIAQELTADTSNDDTRIIETVPELLVRRTGLFEQAQLSLEHQYSSCLYTPSQVYLTDFASTFNCSSSDPCCPFADQYVRFFYGFCPQDTYVNAHPRVNQKLVEDEGGNFQCTVALVYETAQSEDFVAKEAETTTHIPCSLGQSDIDILQQDLLGYYRACRSSVVGAFDQGLPCSTDADCPQHPQVACVSMVFDRTANPSLSSQHRRQKMCQAPTAAWDDLIFTCLIDTMPALVQEAFEQAMGISDTDDFASLLRSFITVTACSATGPSSLQDFAPTIPLQLRNFDPMGLADNTCYNTGTCPFPVNCVDTLCELSQGCTLPWGCQLIWTAFDDGTGEETCNQAYRCNVVTADGPVGCTGTAAECLAECQGSVGADSFCGYCDSVTGYCYVATDSSGVPLSESACTATPADNTCLIKDLASLVAQPCGGLGSCTHYADSSDRLLPTTASQCAGAPGLCLTKERSIQFPPSPGCMGAPLLDGLGCGAAQKTDSGCLYSTALYPDAATCIGAVDPLVSTRQMKGWVELLDTEDKCLNTEALMVCTLPQNDTTPLSIVPNLNSRSLCDFRQGTFGSPYIWEQASFIEGTAVPVTWMSVEAIPSGSWSQRIDYNKFAEVLKQLNLEVQTNADVLTSVCTYSSVLSVATLASGCQTKEKQPNATEACASLTDVTSKRQRAQVLGSQTVCSRGQIDDGTSYPSQLNIPPILLVLVDNSHVSTSMPSYIDGCVALNGRLQSTSKFLLSRRRIRETSFFIVRQDTYIPPLSTFSSGLVPNGHILSNGVRLTQHDTTITHTWMCMTPRLDFLEKVTMMYNNRSDWSGFYLTLGVLDDWQATPLFASSSSDISATFLSAEGVLTTVLGKDFPEGFELLELLEVCMYMSSLDFDPSESRYYVATLTFEANPEDTDNGFNTAETVWLYITAVVYMLPVIVLWLPLVIRSATKGQSLVSVPMIATFFLSLFLVFRATLLFCLAANSVAPSSTTEFALADVAVWCEFAAVSLLALVVTAAVTRSRKMKIGKGFANSRSQQVVFGLLVVFLLALFVAFVIAYSQSGNSSSGITNPTTECAGRLPAGVTFWTTRRILRFTYECVLVLFSLLIGLWLAWISINLTSKSQSQSQLRRLAASTAVLAVAMLSHAIIALILIGTEWTDFIFGITMLYVTEMVPIVAFFFLSLWKNITEFSSLTTSRWTSSRSQSPHNKEEHTASGSRTHTSSG